MNIPELNAAGSALFDSLARASWQGALAAAAIWALCQLFPRLPASSRCWLWRLVLLKMLLAFLWVWPVELEVFSVANSSPPVVPIAVGQGSIEMASAQITAEPIMAPATLNWQSIASVLWIAGLIIGLAKLAVQYRRAQKLRQSSSHISSRASSTGTEDRLLNILIPLVRHVGLSGLPRLLISDTATRPLLIGMVRPALVFPRAIATTLSPESLRMMVAHELAHIRRADLAWSIFAALIQVVFFFHPLVWLARREAILAQEIACDEMAIRATSSPTASYAEMLIRVVSIPVANARKLASLGIADHHKTLERRIRNMKSIGHKKTVLTNLVSTAALIALLLGLLPVRLVEVKAEKTADEKNTDEPGTSEPSEKSEERRIVEERQKLEYTNSLLNELRKRDRSQLREILPTLVPDRSLEAYLKELALAKRQLAAMQGDFSDEHVEVRRINAIIATIDRQIEDRIDGILSSLEIQAEQNKNNLRRAESKNANRNEAGAPIFPGRGAPLQASARVDVYARTGGLVQKVLVKAGDTVKAGQLVIEMDASAAQARLSTAHGRRKAAEADLEVSKAELEQVKMEYKTRTAMIERGAASSDSLPNLNKAQAYVAKSAAMVEVANGEVRQAEIAAEQFNILAPVEGLVTWIIHPGYWVPEAGGKILAHIANPALEQASRQSMLEMLEASLAEMKEKKTDLLERYTAGHPEVAMLEQSISELTRRLAREKQAHESLARPRR